MPVDPPFSNQESKDLLDTFFVVKSVFRAIIRVDKECEGPHFETKLLQAGHNFVLEFFLSKLPSCLRADHIFGERSGEVQGQEEDEGPEGEVVGLNNGTVTLPNSDET